ncbi:hypothetical protein AB0D42_27835 [Streptomyces sp. NPDC048304]|uniref:hypothetical protein n=1 Tax=Streptomyces sp. NPDC048304 TaxID=3154820 RepID=UPI00340D17A4
MTQNDPDLRNCIADLRTRVEQAEELQRIAHETSNRSEAERAKAARRADKAEALLLHFTAEAHRRKWEYDRGLNNDGVPIKSEAFDALHRLGEEMRVKLEELRATAVSSAGPAPATHRDGLREQIAEALMRWAEALMRWAEGNNAPQYASMRRSETVRANAVLAVLPAPDQLAAVRAQAFEDAAKMLAGLDPVKAALAGQYAWNDAAGLVRNMAVQERRLAGEAQQDPTQDGLTPVGGVKGNPFDYHPEDEDAVARPGQPETEPRTIRCERAAWTRESHEPHLWRQGVDSPQRQCPGVDEAQEGRERP